MSVIGRKHTDIIMICMRLRDRNTLKAHELVARLTDHWLNKIDDLVKSLQEKSPNSEHTLREVIKLGETSLQFIDFAKASLNWILDYNDSINSSK